MHAVSSYRGNRPTNTTTHSQTGPITIHCAAASAQCKHREKDTSGTVSDRLTQSHVNINVNVSAVSYAIRPATMKTRSTNRKKIALYIVLHSFYHVLVNKYEYNKIPN